MTRLPSDAPASPADQYAVLVHEVTRLAGIGVFAHDHRTDEIFWSPEVRASCGWGPDDVVSLATLFSQIHEADRPAIAAAVARAHDPTGDGRFDVVHRLHRPDGGLRWLATRSQTFFEGGRAVRTIGAVTDITGHRLVSGTGAPTSTAVELWAILDHSLNEIFLFDSTTLRFVNVNQGALRNLGYDRARMLTMTPVDLKPAYTEPAFRALIAPLLSEQVATLVFETVHERADGTQYPVEVHLQLVTYQGARAFLAVISDITERRAAERTLRLLDSAIATALHPIAITRADGLVEYCNPAMARQWGYAGVDEIVGRQRRDLVSEAEEPKAVAALLARGTWEGEITAVRKDGTTFVCQVAASVVNDAAGTPTHLMGSFVDITERARADAALRASLAEKDALLREVHHRVKNNLQVVTSLLSLQAQRERSDQAIAALRDTQARVRAMALLHETLYRSTSLAQVALAPYLGAICEQLARSFGVGATPRLTVAIDDLVVPLELAMPAGLLLSELVVNALKHAFPAGAAGEIVVSARRLDDGRIEVAVADDGVGLPRDLDPTTTSSLGLRLVQRLAEQLEGELVTERGAPGTVVRVRFASQPSPGGAP